ncbi:GDP-mannose 4,6-dehydratase [Aminipila sp.]|uniref:GDP-mannose 4,6-dehydratase n=1 Tax=Aminipila sp. TaxID=2060095 RepID=UPI0028A29EB6|nr:GDP-mannose 4,6-dehydratase [Aminipila sp.]
MTQVLITGAGGMVGSHMVDYYAKSKSIIGTYFKPTTDISEIEGKADLIECDIRYFTGIYDIIRLHRPLEIFHLAAQSYPSVSWERPQETMEINATGTINLFEAIKRVKQEDMSYDPIVIIACSSAEYGDSLNNCVGKANEQLELLPLHPYGVSKVCQDLLSYQYFVNFGIKAIRARIFNTTGPRKTNDVCSDFTKRIVLMEKNKNTNNILKVGNLQSYRAIADVRDLVNALVLLSEKGRAGEVYNISGSKAYKTEQIVDIIRVKTEINFEIEVDQKLLRPTDEKIIFGDSQKLIKQTGWQQKYDLETTIEDMLNYWRKKL